jgi:putative flippase GtrA
MGTRVANEFWKLTRFSIVGVFATGVYIIAAMIAVEAGGLAPVIGATIGYCASFLVSYLGHSRFTFAVPGRYRDYVLRSAVSFAATFFLDRDVDGYQNSADRLCGSTIEWLWLRSRSLFRSAVIS